METTNQSAGAGAGVGQEVWFVWRGFARRGVIAGFRPWLTDATQMKALLRTEEEEELVDVYMEDVFLTELAATQALLRQAAENVRYLKGKVQRLQRLKREGGRA